MITPLGKNVLLKRKETKNTIIFIPNENNDFYQVIRQGKDVVEQLENKIVFVKEGLIPFEYEDNQYFLVSVEKILAVVEE